MTVKGPIKIIGCGLIGTSIALRLKEKGLTLILADRNERNLKLASDLLEINETLIDPKVIVIATPPEKVYEVAEKEMFENPSAIFIDVTGIKSKLISQVEGFPELSKNYVSVHPMAGRETSGPESARSDLFNSRAWIISKTAHSSAAAIEIAEELGTLMGSTIYELEARTHDSAIAAISHLPQVLSSALGAGLLNVGEDQLNLAGQGLRDVTRLADCDPELWSSLLLGNSEEILPKITEVINRLSALAKAIESSNQSVVKEFLAEGREGRNRIPGKHGLAKRDYTYLPIVIDDKPGGLARIFNECADIDVNIEDLSMEHSPGQAVGLITLALTSDDAIRLQKHLITKGWLAHSPRKD
ncbi:MAG: prephenate dehydrogenase [Actinomycetes bacterium]